MDKKRRIKMKKLLDIVLKVLRIFNLEEAAVVAFISRLGAKGLVALVAKSDNDLDDKALEELAHGIISELDARRS